MEKGNKIRFIIYTIIWVIVCAATGIGIYNYYNGMGVNGKIRSKLIPIIDIFNKNEELNVYKNVGIVLNAEYKKKGILIKYKTEINELNFNFDYQIIDNIETLHMKYNNMDETVATVLLKIMANSIAINKGHSDGELFSKFDYEDFYDTTLEQGVKIIVNQNETEIFFNINATLLDTISDLEIENLYIKQYDLTRMINELNENHKYIHTKGNTKAYIEDTNDKYIIYIRNGKYDDNLYKSIISIIETLNITNNIKEEFKISYPMLNGSKEFGHYIITLDTDVSTINEFTDKDYVIKIEILKDEEVQSETQVDNQDNNTQENNENEKEEN